MKTIPTQSNSAVDVLLESASTSETNGHAQNGHSRPDLHTLVLPADLSANDLTRLATGRLKMKLAEGRADYLDSGHRFLIETIESGESVYGVTTGFGPLVDRGVSHERMVALQENLFQQLSGNVGPDLPEEICRAALALRINALSKGSSGVRANLVQSMIDLLNSGATPVLQSWGSVGASGDLVPLTRIGRVLQGKDRIRMPDGEICDNSPELLDSLGVQPISVGPKEGLGVVNGTSFSAPITSLEHSRLANLLNNVFIPLSATQILLFGDSVQHLSPHVYRHKAHDSAFTVASAFRKWLRESSPELSPGLPQPPYSSRSLVLWYGAGLERIDHAGEVLHKELNAVDDNPLILPDEKLILHAANFQGTYVSLAADELCQAAIHIANAAERQVNRLSHDKLNGDFSAFLAPEPVGVHSGLQGLQLLATSLLADIRAKAMPHSVQTFPTNADNQDIVSMCANAALNLREVVRKTAYIAAVMELYIARALQMRPVELPLQLAEWWATREELSTISYHEANFGELVEQRVAALMELRN